MTSTLASGASRYGLPSPNCRVKSTAIGIALSRFLRHDTKVDEYNDQSVAKYTPEGWVALAKVIEFLRNRFGHFSDDEWTALIVQAVADNSKRRFEILCGFARESEQDGGGADVGWGNAPAGEASPASDSVCHVACRACGRRLEPPVNRPFPCHACDHRRCIPGRPVPGALHGRYEHSKHPPEGFVAGRAHTHPVGRH